MAEGRFRRAIGEAPQAPRGLQPVAPLRRQWSQPEGQRPPGVLAAERAAASTASLLQGRTAGRGAAAIIADARRQLERVHASRLPANAEWRQAFEEREAARQRENRRRAGLQLQLQAELSALVDAIPRKDGTTPANPPRRSQLPDMDNEPEAYVQQLIALLHQHRADLRLVGRQFEHSLAEERKRAQTTAAEHARVEAELRDEITRLKTGAATDARTAVLSPRGGLDSDTLLINWLESGGTDVLAECVGYGAAAAAKSRGADVSATALLAVAASAAESNEALPGTALLHAVVQAVVDTTLGFVTPMGFAPMNDELEAAAVKIQSVTRGRQQRAARSYAGHSGSEVGVGLHTPQSFVVESEDDALTRLEVSPAGLAVSEFPHFRWCAPHLHVRSLAERADFCERGHGSFGRI